ncbi:Alpha/beta hydrolase family protein [Cyclobacterium lianum]|uniref:Alpha/beta hydrolase family protein n=1 Tax=Cyclobacterium lianum TaxID=388280 RepID=A0A1M7NGH9_9BACT|nr:alpha/beta hydrolase [Cyclobacterium lianum]SHN02768.1 Alpha/beta hydrolase family protein [Cyclobacterium lianum]
MSQRKSVFVILVSALLLFAVSSCRQDTVFEEYEIKEFTFMGREAKVVFPKIRNPDNYWIWRARFWGHEPQVDKALLEKGFHLVYVDVADLYGNNEAVALWNKFYDHCISEYGLNPKVVLEGMSRGGLIVYNWASKNTDKVFCIYADAPVCDIKSWPGGMYNGSGSPEDWERCLKAYNLDTISVKTFEDIPVNNSVNIAKAGIPVLHVYGDADTIVPYNENTELLAKKFRDAGGTIEIIRKEGVGHHPHSLEDPKPIVEFILKSIEK